MNTVPKAAIWVLTPGGLRIADKIRQHMPQAHVFVSRSLADDVDAISFERLSEAVSQHFSHYQAHLFIMATGIVVRVIAEHLTHKTQDPAVVVVDDTGRFAISLVSGHIGGANALAAKIARWIDAVPVITTATDVNRLPAIDVLAAQYHLAIENPAAIKTVNMAFLKNQTVWLDDRYHLLSDALPDIFWVPSDLREEPMPGIVVDDRTHGKDDAVLYLRPPILSVGIGCNRGTPVEEIRALLTRVCETHGLSLLSLEQLASIELKKDEPGLLALGNELDLPIRFFHREALDKVETIENPSEYAKKYTGARSVCEAAAILASKSGELIVPKQKTKNVTIAIARRQNVSMWSA